MQIYIGADYRGFEKKKELVKFLISKNYEVTDVGAYSFIEGDDFNDPAIAVARAIRRELGAARGVLVCDSAHGVTMQANRFKGVRAAHCQTEESAKLAREHDDANVLCMSAHFLNEDVMKKIIEVFLDTKFEPLERRIRRINRLDEREDYA